MSRIKYRRIKHPKYKYELTEQYVRVLPEPVPEVFLKIRLRPDTQRFLNLRYPKTGVEMVLSEGYMWDGASGAIDTDDFMDGSAAHDGYYQLVREGEYPMSIIEAFDRRRREHKVLMRKFADDELYRIVREDGMPWVRAYWVWAAVRMFGGKHV